jgi:hypothetical protein
MRLWALCGAFLLSGGCASAEPEFHDPTPDCSAREVERCEVEGESCFAVRYCSGSTHTWGKCACAESNIGAECGEDDDCGPLQVCLGTGTQYLGGSLPTPLCSLRCDDDPKRCAAFEPSAICVVTDDRGTDSTKDDVAHCLEACDVGTGPEGKCHERPELACDALSAKAPLHSPLATMGVEAPASGVCRPLCTRDDECAAGHCNPRTGACSTIASEGLGFGAQCDPDAEEPGCAGICVDVEGVGICSQRCKLGDAKDCSNASGDTPGLCLFAEESSGSVSDVGFCDELCNCSDDCTHPDTFCEAFPDSRLRVNTGRAGMCKPRGSMSADGGLSGELVTCLAEGDAG